MSSSFHISISKFLHYFTLPGIIHMDSMEWRVDSIEWLMDSMDWLMDSMEFPDGFHTV